MLLLVVAGVIEACSHEQLLAHYDRVESNRMRMGTPNKDGSIGQKQGRSQHTLQA